MVHFQTLNFILLIFTLNLVHTAFSHNKYTADANSPGPDLRPLSLKELDKPFRMAKLNLLWSKAKLVSFGFQAMPPLE